MSKNEKVKVKQIRSVAGRDKRVKATVQALGLGRIGDTQEHIMNPAIRGMLKKISHLVFIERA